MPSPSVECTSIAHTHMVDGYYYTIVCFSASIHACFVYSFFLHTQTNRSWHPRMQMYEQNSISISHEPKENAHTFYVLLSISFHFISFFYFILFIWSVGRYFVRFSGGTKMAYFSTEFFFYALLCVTRLIEFLHGITTIWFLFRSRCSFSFITSKMFLLPLDANGWKWLRIFLIIDSIHSVLCISFQTINDKRII